MKTVFTNREIVHIWAHRSQASGRTSHGNMFFDSATIYSYGHHFPIATHVKNGQGHEAVLFTTADYSVTTAGHKSRVRDAIYGQMFYVPLSTNDTYTLNHSERYTNDELRKRLNQIIDRYVSDYAERVKDAELAAGRARKNADWKMERLENIIKEANDFCTFFGIGRSFETSIDAEELRQKVNEYARKEKERNKIKQAQLEIENREAINDWLAGRRDYIPYSVDKTYLRIVGDQVETSKGARFPVSHAVKGLRFVRQVMDSGREYVSNGHTFHLGNYAIDWIGVNGDVKAGCHYVTWSEIERISAELEATAEVMKTLQVEDLAK